MELSSFRRPSAWIPVAMSVTALTVVLLHVAIYGAAREADEGATAHIFQLLMAGQAPVLLWFALWWLPKDPRQSAMVLAIQVGAIVVAFAPVYLLKL
jgi:TRAP-type mannitol/chloroaromatic compound transport system permease large subunit